MPVLVLLAAASRPALPAPTESEIKAAFLYNFASFVTWPDADRGRAELRICAHGEGTDDIADALRRIAAGRDVDGRPIAIERPVTTPQLRRCDILYSDVTGEAAEQLFDDLDGRPVLTVGDHRDFVRRGGAMRFFILDDRVRFAANPYAAERVGLRLSSHLLRLAVLEEE